MVTLLRLGRKHHAGGGEELPRTGGGSILLGHLETHNMDGLDLGGVRDPSFRRGSLNPVAALG